VRAMGRIILSVLACRNSANAASSCHMQVNSPCPLRPRLAVGRVGMSGEGG
jgi:hypothetical protein